MCEFFLQQNYVFDSTLCGVTVGRDQNNLFFVHMGSENRLVGEGFESWCMELQ